MTPIGTEPAGRAVEPTSSPPGAVAAAAPGARSARGAVHVTHPDHDLAAALRGA